MNKYYCYNRNKNYKNTIEKIIQNNKDIILDFFDFKLDKEINFNIYIYDTVEDLVNGLEKRGFLNMPSHMCACQKDEDKSLNFFEPKDNPSSNEWSKEEYEKVIFHELIHGIQFNIYGHQPEWLTEGIAKYLDGTYKKGIKYLFENYIHKNRIPSMYELENEFGQHQNEYDSYDYAFIMVSYLLEIFGHDAFLQLISNSEELNKISPYLLINAICYYNKKYFNNEFYNADLLNPQWLFHGSSLKLNNLEPRLSHDSNGNKENIDTAVFTTSSIKIASAYAFKDSIKENSKDLDWDFEIFHKDIVPIMQMQNVRTDDELEGYIYVFINDGSFKNEPKESLQFKSYKKLIPIECKKIKYKDFKHLYEISLIKRR